jgi:virginiamycin B lyase
MQRWRLNPVLARNPTFPGWALLLLIALCAVLLTACVQKQSLADGFTAFSLPSGHGRLGLITSGPDHNLWFAAFDDGKIGRLTPQGELTEFPLPNQHAAPYALLAGPDGALWFTESYASAIGRITPDGHITEYTGLSSAATALALGPDDAIWFGEYGGDMAVMR